MRQTSIAAHEDIKAKGTKQKHHAEILKVMTATREYSTIRISKRSKLDRHQVARRMKEMVDRGLVVETGIKYCKVNERCVIHYKKA